MAATIGMILRALEERMGLIGRLVMRIIGIAWAVACYFVVPVLAFEDLTPIAAIKRSSRLFRDTWGEKVKRVRDTARLMCKRVCWLVLSGWPGLDVE